MDTHKAAPADSAALQAALDQASRLLFAERDPAAASGKLQPALQQVLGGRAAHDSRPDSSLWPWESLDALTLLAAACTALATQPQQQADAAKGSSTAREGSAAAEQQWQGAVQAALWNLALACLCQSLLDAGARGRQLLLIGVWLVTALAA